MADATVRTRGTRFYIGTTAATAASDTYTEIEQCRAIDGGLGTVWSQIDTSILSNTYKQTEKGLADAGTLTIGGLLFQDPTDGLAPGQAALKAACEDDSAPDVYNFKLVGADGRIAYIKARVFAWTIQAGNNANMREFRSTLMAQSAYTEAAAA